MQDRRIAGPYAPSYPEILRKLIEEVDYLGTQIYFALITLFRVDEDWSQEENPWVCGIVDVTKMDIVREVKASRSGFYHAWRKLIDSGLVVDRTAEDYIKLPYFKKKADESISPREIHRRISQIEKTQDMFGKQLEDAKFEALYPLLAQANVRDDSYNVRDERAEVRDERATLAGARLYNDLKQINKLKEEENPPLSILENRDPDQPENDEDHTDETELATPAFIFTRADSLWPGRGYRGDKDDLFIAEIKKFPLAAVQEAFDAAGKAEITYGKWEWIINRLRQPRFYRDDIKEKAEKAEKRQEFDPDIGVMPDNWLQENEDEEE